ncbi:MAG: response regulator transcription factor [Anaerolineae bacterium]|nr:response regulator transcription factor [Anaerolineae bacterium]
MRILVADRQAKVRFALRVLLERQPGFQVVGEAANAADLFDHATIDSPELILLDWDLVAPMGAGTLLSLRRACPDVSVIALSGRAEARKAALDAGADAFVSKGDPPERLLNTITRCHHKTCDGSSTPTASLSATQDIF